MTIIALKIFFGRKTCYKNIGVDNDNKNRNDNIGTIFEFLPKYI